jgi:hypothetical protein
MVDEQNNWRSSPIGENCTKILSLGDGVLDEFLLGHILLPNDDEVHRTGEAVGLGLAIAARNL